MIGLVVIPIFAVIDEIARQFSDFSDMRLAVQLLLIEFPQCREPRVRQLELAVGAEHRDSLEQIVEGRALYRRQRAVGALEGVSIGETSCDMN